MPAITPCPTTRDFEIITPSTTRRNWLQQADPYSAARAFIRGDITVAGDLVEAVRFQLSQAQRHYQSQFMNLLGRLAFGGINRLLQTRARTADNIRFHYDRSNDFYHQFLGPHMVYSCAYFSRPMLSLDEAQLAKLDLVCAKLRLLPGERFLDVGCGWGTLVVHASSHYKTISTGVTLSHQQASYAAALIEQQGLGRVAVVHEKDYRDLPGQYDKIASIGMFEHVGHAHLASYMKKIRQLLHPEGLFLNHGITLPASEHHDAQSIFISHDVFPGGQIVPLATVLETAEKAGLEVIDLENMRRHYALTCRAWVERLRQNEEACLRSVDVTTWRTWQLYLAGSAVAFEDGTLGVHQIVFARKGAVCAAPMTREYMYKQ